MSDALPRMIPVRRTLPPAARLHVAEAVAAALRPSLPPGASVAVGVGSRGITQLAEIVEAAIAALRERGLKPFIVPAMGSHGGATPEGQAGLLAEYGVTEARMGVPIRAGMETEGLGTTADGLPVHFSSEALKADAILPINRVKPHTDFGGPLGSGIVKMIAIGYGKQRGAAAYHAEASRAGMEHVIRGVLEVVLPRVTIAGALAVVEDARHAPARIEFLGPEGLIAAEERLQAEARALMPGLPFDEMDLLIVDRLGKNVSGAGMDPNVTGRHVHGYSSALRDHRTKPIIHRLLVLELTPESHGNAIGIGMADFATERLVRSIDPAVTAMNAFTSLSLNSFKIPPSFPTDREAVRVALSTVPRADGRPPRVVRILDTLSLEAAEVSEAYAGAVAARPDLSALGPAREMRFDAEGRLLPIEA